MRAAGQVSRCFYLHVGLPLSAFVMHILIARYTLRPTSRSSCSDAAGYSRPSLESLPLDWLAIIHQSSHLIERPYEESAHVKPWKHGGCGGPACRIRDPCHGIHGSCALQAISGDEVFEKGAAASWCPIESASTMSRRGTKSKQRAFRVRLQSVR